MSTRNLTPPAPSAMRTVGAGEERRGRLQAPHSAVTVTVLPFVRYKGSNAIVTYLGTAEALLAAGCLTPKMMTGRKRGVRCEDEEGQWFWIRRAPCKSQPNCLKLVRDIDQVSYAMELPGVRDLYPEGLPDPLPEAKPQANNLAEWAERQRNGLRLFILTGLASVEGCIARESGVESMHEDLRHIGAPPDPTARFRWAPGEVERVRQFLAATERQFETLLDSMRAEDRNRLKLLVFH